MEKRLVNCLWRFRITSIAILCGCRPDDFVVDSDSAPTDADTEPRETDDTSTPLSPIPVAVCGASVTEVATPFGVANLAANESYVPNGASIETYIWSMVGAPPGSDSVLLPAGISSDRQITLDLGGTYVARLVARAGAETSAPCEVSLHGRPPDDLVVEMFWTTSGDDMDLHVVAPNGTLVGSGDCYYGNCQGTSLDWGVAGSGGDPHMFMDDIPGTGPEITTVGAPIGDGTYTVIVSDHPGSAFNGPNPTTVNIFVRGVLVWTGTREMNVTEGTYVSIASIDFPSGAVQECADTGC